MKAHPMVGDTLLAVLIASFDPADNARGLELSDEELDVPPTPIDG